MSDSRDYLEMSFRSIQCFANDGRLDSDELDKLIAIAERDGRIDQNETRVLRNIIGRISPSEVDTAMKERLQALATRLKNGPGIGS